MKNLPSLSIFKGYFRFYFIGRVVLDNIPSLSKDRIQIGSEAFRNVREMICSNADSLEYVVTLNSHVTPTEHLISLNPSAIWVSTVNQEIPRSVKCLVIQANVGRASKSFYLSNLSFLNSLINSA
ncbi:hypothetical protein WA171_006603 [Blastocystis sp. BT1]